MKSNINQPNLRFSGSLRVSTIKPSNIEYDALYLFPATWVFLVGLPVWLVSNGTRREV